MSFQVAYIIGLILFCVLIYLLIRILGDLTPKLIIRCTSCGKVRDADEAGVVRVTVIPLFSNTFDWCPGCGDVLVHKVDKRFGLLGHDEF